MENFPPFLKFIIFQFGLPNVLVMLQFSQLSAQLLAKTHCNLFLSLSGTFSLVYLALAIERLGMAQITVVFVGLAKALMRTLNKHDMKENGTLHSEITVINEMHVLDMHYTT